MNIKLIGNEALSLQSVFSGLKLGRIISAEVIETVGDRVFLDVGGKVVSARTQLNFTPGQKLELKVAGIKNGEIILKLPSAKPQVIGAHLNPVNSNTVRQIAFNMVSTMFSQEELKNFLSKLENISTPNILRKITVDLNSSNDTEQLAKALEAYLKNFRALVENLRVFNRSELIEDLLNFCFKDSLLSRLDDGFVYFTFPLRASREWEVVELRIKTRENKKKIDVTKKLRIDLKITTKNLGTIRAEFLLQDRDIVGDIKVQNYQLQKIVDEKMHTLEAMLNEGFNVVSLKCSVDENRADKPGPAVNGFKESAFDLKI